MTTETEIERLDRVAQGYRPEGFEKVLVRDSGNRVLARCQGTTCLEVGSALGGTTEMLANRFDRLVVMEPAEAYADAVRELNLPSVEVAASLVEDFETDEKFDTIVMAHVLEHVEDPVDALRRCKDMLAPDGIIVVVVPNGGSLHRRLGVTLGMLEKMTDFSPADVSIGHRRVYETHTLRTDIESAGLTVTDLAGHFCKPLSSSQIDALPAEVQKGLAALGDELPPEYASEILIVCRP
jgi:2-polyprenyl-3-methyl-5-hydroxy-6-metoxy-1,4-benzoquinol methylase